MFKEYPNPLRGLFVTCWYLSFLKKCNSFSLQPEKMKLNRRSFLSLSLPPSFSICRHCKRKAKGLRKVMRRKSERKREQRRGRMKGEGMDRAGQREVCRLLYEADLDRRRGLDTGSVSGALPKQLQRNACVRTSTSAFVYSLRCIPALVTMIKRPKNSLCCRMMKQ